MIIHLSLGIRFDLSWKFDLSLETEFIEVGVYSTCPQNALSPECRHSFAQSGNDWPAFRPGFRW